MPIQIAILIPMPVNAKWSNIDGIDIFTSLFAIGTNIKKHALVFYEKIVYIIDLRKILSLLLILCLFLEIKVYFIVILWSLDK